MKDKKETATIWGWGGSWVGCGGGGSEAQEVARAKFLDSSKLPSLRSRKEASVALAELTSLERLAGHGSTMAPS